MNHLLLFWYLLKKSIRALAVSVVIIFILWTALYHLTDAETVKNYFWTGAAVYAGNNLIYNLSLPKIKKTIHLPCSWIIMAGVVLVLYHAGFEAAAVFAAATIFASPFLGATIYEGFVGFTLLITLARLIF
jgi:hypothetical protein